MPTYKGIGMPKAKKAKVQVVEAIQEMPAEEPPAPEPPDPPSTPPKNLTVAREAAVALADLAAQVTAAGASLRQEGSETNGEEPREGQFTLRGREPGLRCQDELA